LERDDDQGDNAELEIKGIISSIDLTKDIIVVSGVEINISEINNFTAKLGNEIEAKGRLVAGIWLASELSIDDDDDNDNDDSDDNDDNDDDDNND